MQGIDHKKARTRVCLLLAACFAVGVFGVCPASAGDYRAKIDGVDTSKAPEIRLFVTFLNRTDLPVNPNLIDLYDVKINDTLVDDDDVELGIWRDEEEGTDLVLVMPGIVGLSEAARKTISEEMKVLEKAMGPKDRVAMVTYSRAVAVVQPLDEAKGKAKEAFDKITPAGVRPFMFSALDQAIEVLETSPEGRKRAILYLGDGTDAGAVGVAEIDEKLRETVARARRAKTKIWSIGFDSNEVSENSRRTFQLLSRKTGATWRFAKTRLELTRALEGSLGEIIGQLVLKLHWGDFEEKKVYDFQVQLQSDNSEETETAVFKAPVEKVRTDWVFWAVVSVLACVVALIVAAFFTWLVVWLRRRRDRREAEALLAELLEDRVQECETCFRVQKPEWEECPFCAAGMKPLSGTQKAPPFVYDDEDNKLCNVCGRVCLPEWTACAFCAEGMEVLPEWQKVKDEEALLTGNVDMEKMAEDARKKSEEEAAVAQAAAAVAAEEARQRQDQLSKGGKECPACGRIMDPSWPECLFCASGAAPQ